VEFHQRLEPAGNGQDLEARFLRHLAVQTRIDRLAYLTPVHSASSWLGVRASWGLSQPLAERLRLPAAGELVSLLEATGRPLLVEPLGSLPGLRLEAGLLAAGGVRACVPLLLKGRLLGILLLGEMEGGGTPDEETLLSAHLLASALAPALAADQGWAEERRLTSRTLGVFVSQLEERSPYLKGHSLRVSRLAEGIGEQMGLGGVDLSHLATSALLHDIGRFEVDAAFWSKEEPLTSEDWKLIRRHPDEGARLLADADWPEPILGAVRHHHERWDGSGYPAGLRREAIPFHARILAVADALDALTSPRPHRPALLRGDALRVLHEDSGRRYDPEVVGVVVRCEEEEHEAAV
jgi:putative nucleotidyltransferase with HDIG domain